MQSNPKDRRWRPQFSLRSLVLVMLLISAGLGWLGIAVDRTRNKQRAILAIEKMTLGYSKEYNELTQLHLGNGEVKDEDLIQLKWLTTLERLDLRHTQITDTGLVHLQALPRLEWLRIRNTQISDGGVNHLKQLPRLKWLDIEGTKISSAGYQELKLSMPNCRIKWDSHPELRN